MNFVIIAWLREILIMLCFWQFKFLQFEMETRKQENIESKSELWNQKRRTKNFFQLKRSTIKRVGILPRKTARKEELNKRKGVSITFKSKVFCNKTCNILSQCNILNAFNFLRDFHLLLCNKVTNQFMTYSTLLICMKRAHASCGDSGIFSTFEERFYTQLARTKNMRGAKDYERFLWLNQLQPRTLNQSPCVIRKCKSTRELGTSMWIGGKCSRK